LTNAAEGIREFVPNSEVLKAVNASYDKLLSVTDSMRVCFLTTPFEFVEFINELLIPKDGPHPKTKSVFYYGLILNLNVLLF